MAETPFTPVAPEGQPEQPAAAPAEVAAVPAEVAAVPAAEPVQEAMAPAAEAPAEEPVAPETEPSIATTLEVAPLPEAGAMGGSEAGAEGSAEGGEFDLLIGKISAWLEGLELAERWQKLRGPLRGAALLLALLLVLRLYGRVVGTIDGIPVISGLLELTGLIYALWFSATKLIRTSERERVLADWKQRWQAFTGRD
jgi:hypothetical protein